MFCIMTKKRPSISSIFRKFYAISKYFTGLYYRFKSMAHFKLTLCNALVNFPFSLFSSCSGTCVKRTILLPLN